MSNNVDSQQLDSFVPVYDAVPEKWEDARPFLVEQLKKITNAVNIREIGWFLDQEALSGQQFIPTSAQVSNTSGTNEQFRSIFRKVIDFGMLPNSMTKSVAHEITFDINFSLMNLYISATDPINFKAFSLQYWAKNTPGDIIINMDATNINVTTASDYTAYTRSWVVIEYIQEV